MRRRRIGRRRSKKLYRKGRKVNRRNRVRVRRGGYRF